MVIKSKKCLENNPDAKTILLFGFVFGEAIMMAGAFGTYYCESYIVEPVKRLFWPEISKLTVEGVGLKKELSGNK